MNLDRTLVAHRSDLPVFAWEARQHHPRTHGKWLIASLVIGALVVAGRAMDVEGLVIAVVLIIAVVFSAFYVVWRRRRNERLNGSPTQWPSE